MSYVAPDRGSHVLVAGSHRGVRPTHHSHNGTLGYPEQEQHGRGGVPGVVEPTVSDAGGGEQVLPVVPVGAGVEWASGRCGEDVTGLLPELTHLDPLGVLLTLVLQEEEYQLLG